MRPKDNLITFIKGFFLGVANVIPGVSGGTLAVSLGLYEKMLGSVSNFFKNPKKNLQILTPILLGILVAIISTSKLVTFALANYKAQTVLLFVGLIFGGTSLIMKKTRGKGSIINYILFFITFALVIVLNFVKFNNLTISFVNMNFIDYFLLIVIGFIASSAMVIPGISGSFILMLLGYYEKIVGTVSNLTNFKELGSNLTILVPFGVGVLIGIIFMAKLITIMIKKYEVKTYFAIMGFVLASIVVLIIGIIPFKISFGSIMTCTLSLLWGYCLARAIDKE